MSPIEKQRAKVAALRAEKDRTDAEAAADLAAHSAFVLGDDAEEAAFGSAKAAALLRKAGESRVRADSLAHVLAQAEAQLTQAERAEETRVQGLRWRASLSDSAARLDAAKAVAKACADLADAYIQLVTANAKLVDSIPNNTTIDRSAGYFDMQAIEGVTRLELSRLGVAWAAKVSEPHIIEPLAEKFHRTHKWINNMASGA